MKAITLQLGLDVHKDSITIAIAEPGSHLEAAYEAGPCGFVIARRLKQLKVPCLVAAPSLIPKQPGSPFKTDKRDARTIARLLRAGELTGVYVPEPTDEAIRDLCRARTDAVDDQRRCRFRLKAFLLRHGYRYQGKAVLGRRSGTRNVSTYFRHWMRLTGCSEVRRVQGPCSGWFARP